MSEQELAVTNNNMFIAPVANVGQAIQRYQDMKDFIAGVLRENTDYGTIPGTNKPTLLKPGAEKLATFFGLSVSFSIIEHTQDWSGINHEGEPFFNYWYKCTVSRNGKLIAEGEGSANSFEKKYRWRSANVKCPACGKEAIIKGKSEFGGGWICFDKKGGCKAKFKDGDASIENQPRGQVRNPDIADVVNTLQKMAQKRAYVAAVLLAVNGSDYFTQDLEDFDVASFGVSQPIITIIDPTPQPTSLIDAIQEEGGVPTAPDGKPEPAHDWENMTKGELAGRLNEYIKRLKESPQDEDALKKRDEAKYWLEQKNKAKQ